ncbi:hypothetical protein LEM8419_00659 [Neolewinella maritima]|uniref:Putative restriction endonuclease domain-containing protein n=1 Tax=Neolewinella maritima TaxID=1383882 RepID=A0ABN8F3K8_9BACT|nr:Uma2 family endonuclease [Neolewinella maritima]CAH0999361.1 hypothetical protein LEM8419_00659 [Neolewinella maritima]
MPFTIELPADRRVQLRFEDSLTPVEFAAFCARHPELLVEREPDGQLSIMSPVHLLSGGQEADIVIHLGMFVLSHKLGKVYSPTTGFTLPDGSVRSADASFVSKEQLDRLTQEQKHSFAPVVPEFIVEIRSDTDRIGRLQTKLREVWIANGVQLAWLIDPKNQLTYIYRSDGSEQVITGFDKVLSGETVLPGFELPLGDLEIG